MRKLCFGELKKLIWPWVQYMSEEGLEPKDSDYNKTTSVYSRCTSPLDSLVPDLLVKWKEFQEREYINPKISFTSIANEFVKSSPDSGTAGEKFPRQT